MKANIVCILLILMGLEGCTEKIDMNYKNREDMESIKYEAIEGLKDKKIFFGHQSVGYNIVTGIEDIKANDERLHEINILEIDRADDLDKPAFYHGKVGKNGLPEAKVKGFKNLLYNEGLGNKLDIAFFKFCYVDFKRDSNVQGIFDYYVETIDFLKKEFPDLTIVHVTTPLTAHTWGIKSFIKGLIKSDITNVKRNQFNELLLNKYKNVDPVYDLAKIESQYPDGKRSSFRYKGKTYSSLVKQYTYDGGHLNETGRYYAAKELLRVLSELKKANF